jgi:hypothetical protein
VQKPDLLFFLNNRLSQCQEYFPLSSSFSEVVLCEVYNASPQHSPADDYFSLHCSYTALNCCRIYHRSSAPIPALLQSIISQPTQNAANETRASPVVVLTRAFAGEPCLPLPLNLRGAPRLQMETQNQGTTIKGQKRSSRCPCRR